MGLQLYLLAKGIDRSEVMDRLAVKSLSRETTFEADTADSVSIFQMLDALCEAVQEEIVNKHLLFKTVTVKIRYKNFETHAKSKTLTFLTNRV